jgi:hypothetical protein
MTLSALVALMPMLLGLAAVQEAPAAPGVRRVIVQDQLIVRVPVRPLPPLQVVWQPARALKCVQVSAIRGAMLAGPEQVDILIPQQRRVRAHFSANCHALDFYGGFYLKPEDTRLCAGRDSVYSRMGGNCRVERLDLLVPRLRR